MPSLKRASPCVLINIKNQNILVDAGPGSLRKLLEIGLTYQDIDLLLFTHLHTDHTLELINILFVNKNGLSLRVRPLPVFGPPGFGDFYKKIINLYGDWVTPKSYQLEIKELLNSEYDLSDFKIISKPLQHSEKSIGYRIQQGNKSVVISGDTDYCQEIIQLSKEAELLVLECAFPDELKAKGHLTPSLAGKIAKEANCKQLILTHLYPVCESYSILEPCQKTFGGKVKIANDLMQINV